MTPREQIGLIRSIAGWAEGRETDAIDEIRAVIAGASLEDLAAFRATDPRRNPAPARPPHAGMDRLMAELDAAHAPERFGYCP